jgi:hypothetical protein
MDQTHCTEGCSLLCRFSTMISRLLHLGEAQFLCKLPGRASFIVRAPDVPAPTITSEACEAAAQQIYIRSDYVSVPDLSGQTVVRSAPLAPEAVQRVIGSIKRNYPAQRRRRQRHRRRR